MKSTKRRGPNFGVYTDWGTRSVYLTGSIKSWDDASKAIHDIRKKAEKLWGSHPKAGKKNADMEEA